MKQAKQTKRTFKDLSAWDVLTGEAEKRKRRMEWQKMTDLYYAISNTGKSMMSDYMISIQSVSRGMRKPASMIDFKSIKE